MASTLSSPTSEASLTPRDFRRVRTPRTTSRRSPPQTKKELSAPHVPATDTLSSPDPPILDFSMLPTPHAVGAEEDEEEEEEQSSDRPEHHARPQPQEVADAGAAVVCREDGVAVRFATLLDRKRVVLFPSSWSSSAFQKLVKGLSRVPPASFARAGLSVIAVGPGSIREMAAFQRIFSVPFALYVDPKRSAADALGLHVYADEPSLAPRQAKSTHSLRRLRASAPARPLQGGIFVLGPGIECSFALRISSKPEEVISVPALLSAWGVSEPTHMQAAGKPLYDSPKERGGLLHESKQRLSFLLGRRPVPSTRRPALESMTNFSEPMCNPDPFAPPSDEVRDQLTPAPWRRREPSWDRPMTPFVSQQPGRGKLSVRQLTTAALQPMEEQGKGEAR